MRILFLPVLFFTLTFFFTLFVQGHDDFILTKKNISMEKIFNSAFLFLVCSIVFSSLFFSLFHLHYFQLLFFSGFSLFGLLIGGGIFIFTYFKHPKNPKLRIFDFFSMAFLFAYTVGFLFESFLLFFGRRHMQILIFEELVFLILISAFFISYIIPKIKKGEFQDGSAGLIFYILFSPIVLLQDRIIRVKDFKLNLEGILILLLLLIFLWLLATREKIIFKLNNYLKSIKNSTL